MKIKIDDALLARATQAAELAGYSSVDEFITHCVESGIQKVTAEKGLTPADAEAERQVAEQLRGLGYIE